MKLRFTKMQGAGNDFVVIDGVSQPVDLSTAQWKHLADRHFGVGADQCLLVERTDRSGVDFRYRIFNADGGEVEHCGNGARCFLRFVRDKGLATHEPVRVETLCGVLSLSFAPDGRVAVDMGAPRFEPARVPFDPAGLESRREGDDVLWRHPLPDGGELWFSALSMGNPHAVCLVEDADTADVTGAGALLERSACFPQRANIGFMEVLGRDEIRLRVWERGVGETLACGTGACAAVVAGIRRGLLDPGVEVHTRGGKLRIHWAGASVTLTGPAETVFEGEIEL
ncbi:MAG: diaminopimelate epimerase [Burkholderiaceae bacterium]|nr:diaminopimelate epimerase [Burkholderiaceae bacterium]MCO5119390.1 diaminopimelate epimerase [Burkholderiaceae bacterium]